MSACRRCGTTPPDGANYCAQCGAALDGAPTIDPFTDATGDGFVTPSTGGTSRWPILVGTGLIVGARIPREIFPDTSLDYITVTAQLEDGLSPKTPKPRHDNQRNGKEN